MELRDISITEYDLRRLKELVQVGISSVNGTVSPWKHCKMNWTVRILWSRQRCPAMWSR
jgi:hypothetical protein